MSTYAYSVQVNWGVSLPKPDHETTIMSSRGGMQGDGDAITQLQYNSQADIRRVEVLSIDWVDGKTFAKEEQSFTGPIQNLIKDVDPQARYFYLEKNGSDYIVFELKGHAVTVYESYL